MKTLNILLSDICHAFFMLQLENLDQKQPIDVYF